MRGTPDHTHQTHTHTHTRTHLRTHTHTHRFAILSWGHPYVSHYHTYEPQTNVFATYKTGGVLPPIYFCSTPFICAFWNASNISFLISLHE